MTLAQPWDRRRYRRLERLIGTRNAYPLWGAPPDSWEVLSVYRSGSDKLCVGLAWCERAVGDPTFGGGPTRLVNFNEMDLGDEVRPCDDAENC